MTRFQTAFGALVLAQSAHSAEEYLGRLWESFPPARFVGGLISEDLERGFLMANIGLVALGLWCWLWPVGRKWSVAVPLAWPGLQLRSQTDSGTSSGRWTKGAIHLEWGPRRCCSSWRPTSRVSCGR